MRDLPKHVYANGNKFAAIVRHQKKRVYLGTYDTVEEAVSTAALFRKHNPKPEPYRWKPGDKLNE